MSLIKQYKTISILVFLIIVFGILAIFVKAFDIGGIKNIPDATMSLTPTPTPASDSFIRPDSLNIPSSYMGYSVTKTTQADLGKNAIQYGTQSANLDGTEWIISKKNVSDMEYSQIKPLIESYIQGQLTDKGWKATTSISGRNLVPNVLKIGDLSKGFVQVSNGKFQEAILDGGKESSGNVNIKIFLSNIYDLNKI